MNPGVAAFTYDATKLLVIVYLPASSILSEHRIDIAFDYPINNPTLLKSQFVGQLATLSVGKDLLDNQVWRGGR